MLIAVIESDRSVTRLEWLLTSPEILKESRLQQDTSYPDLRISFINKSAFEAFANSNFSLRFSSDHVLDLSVNATLDRSAVFDFLIKSSRKVLRKLPTSLPHRFLRMLSILQLLLANARLRKRSQDVEEHNYTPLIEIIDSGDVDAFIADSPQAVELCNTVRNGQKIYIL